MVVEMIPDLLTDMEILDGVVDEDYTSTDSKTGNRANR